MDVRQESSGSHIPKCTTGPYPNANLDGLGTLGKFPREIRDQILFYVMDLNSKFVDYFKGSEKTDVPDSKENYVDRYFRLFSILDAQSSSLDSLSTMENISCPYRTTLLAVSKALSGEALEAMFNTNRFIIRMPQPRKTAVFELYVWKEGTRNLSYSEFEPTLQKPWCPYWRALSQYITAKLRRLSLFMVGHQPRPYYIFAKATAESCSRMLEFIGSFQAIHRLEIKIFLERMSTEDRNMFLPVIKELSNLRGIRKLEAKACFLWPYDGSYSEEPRDISCPSLNTALINPEHSGSKSLFLTKEYAEYLRSTAQNEKGVEVAPYETYMLSEERVWHQHS